MRLSTDDLAVFFDREHHALADELRAMAEPLARAETDAETAAGAATAAAEHPGDAGMARARAVARAMGQHGLYRWLVPRAPDRPIDVRALCLIREFLGQVTPLGDAIFAVQGLGSYPLSLARSGPPDGDQPGTAEAGILLDPYRTGEIIGGFALTEPEAGSDVASMQTVARPVSTTPDSTRYALDGVKTLISNVGIASRYVVFANADPDAGRKGITAFTVERDAPGLEETPIALNIDHPIGALHLRDCQATLLGEVGGGFALAMQTLDTFRVSVGAAAVGMARRALDAALDHVRGRVQFGKPLAHQPVVQSMLADMATDLDAARLLVLRAAHAKDQLAGAGADGAPLDRRQVTTAVAMAKLHATEVAQTIIDRAVQLLGGRGVMAGEVVEMLYRAIRPLRIYEGTSEIQRLIIGRAITR